jgi:hypothetical protein
LSPVFISYLPTDDSQLVLTPRIDSKEVANMRIRTFLAMATVALLIGCGSSTSPVSPVTPANPQSARGYNGTASVGDFLNITLDPAAHTITYSNKSNGDSGVVPYTVNPDGTYTLNDPTGNLVSAYEVPNFALLIQAAKTGPNHNTPALITAVESGQISIATWASQQYNYIQFRTAAGGMEIGSVNISAAGDIGITHFWPYGAFNNDPGGPFGGGSFSHTLLQNDPSGTFMKISEAPNPGFDYVFGTPTSGMFAVDTPNGAIVGLKKAASKNFDPTMAGSYKAIYYQKTGANTGQGNVETGTASLGNATITISAAAGVTVQNSQGATILQATLTPVADTAYLYDGTVNKLQDPCWGLFTFRVVNGSSTQDVFVTFVNGAILFSAFTSNGPNQPYDYLYGTGLK